MKCPNCRCIIPENSDYCPYCFQKFDNYYVERTYPVFTYAYGNDYTERIAPIYSDYQGINCFYDYPVKKKKLADINMKSLLLLVLVSDIIILILLELLLFIS